MTEVIDNKKIKGDAMRRRILKFIKKFWLERMMSPTRREIMRGVGLNSTSVVNWHLMIMRDEGTIDFDDSNPRTIRPSGMVVSFEPLALETTE